LALRSPIVLACADGRPNTKIADELGCDRVTVGTWRHRFAAERLEGLVDAPRPGAARTISDEVVEAVEVETLETTGRGRGLGRRREAADPSAQPVRTDPADAAHHPAYTSSSTTSPPTRPRPCGLTPAS
jgi:hypothetical protein